MNGEQLSALKVKHLRSYLAAKRINHQTCTEKQDLVDLIVSHRHVPFSSLSITTQSATTAPSSQNSNSTGGRSNFQNTMSSFADQVNNLATNLSNTVSGVINQALGDDVLQANTSETATGPPPSQSSQSASSQPRATAQPPPPPPVRPPPTTTTTTTTNTNTTNHARPRRKSLSELNTEEKIEDLNIRELKEILAANFVDYKGCVEKNELIERVRRLYRDREMEKQRAKDFEKAGVGDHELCKICMDAIADCVFLDCGHMVTCVQCGKLLAECPICRANIVRVVRVFKS